MRYIRPNQYPGIRDGNGVCRAAIAGRHRSLDAHHYRPQDIPTEEEKLDVYQNAIVATCRSCLNTSTPVKTLGQATYHEPDSITRSGARRATLTTPLLP
jgi:hypothetical protein